MKYVCSGAKLRCSMGTSLSILNATPKNIILQGRNQANVTDFVSVKNVPGFGLCRSLAYPPTAAATAANHGVLTPRPCTPGTCSEWTTVDPDSLVHGSPALLEPAKLKCMYGGVISIVNPGQFLEHKIRPAVFSDENEPEKVKEQDISQEMEGLPDDLVQELNEFDSSGLDCESVLNGIQTTLTILGFVPVIGFVPDLVNAYISYRRGDPLSAGISVLSAVPGVGDAAGGLKVFLQGAKIAKNAKKVKNVKNIENISKINLKSPKSSTTNLKNEYIKADQGEIKITNKNIKVEKSKGRIAYENTFNFLSVADSTTLEAGVKRNEKK